LKEIPSVARNRGRGKDDFGKGNPNTEREERKRWSAAVATVKRGGKRKGVVTSTGSGKRSSRLRKKQGKKKRAHIPALTVSKKE